MTKNLGRALPPAPSIGQNPKEQQFFFSGYHPLWQHYVHFLWQLLTSHNPRQTVRAQTISNGTALENIQSLILFPLSGVGQAKRSVLGHLGKLRWVSTDNCWAHMGSDTEWRKLKAGAGAVGHIWLILVWNVLLLKDICWWLRYMSPRICIIL